MFLKWDDLRPVVVFANRLPCAPGFKFGPRTISDHQFIYVAAGKGTAIIQNRRYEASRGGLFYYGPDIVHTFEADADDPMIVYGLHFKVDGQLPERNQILAGKIQEVTGDYEASIPNRLQIGETGWEQLDIPEHFQAGTTWALHTFERFTELYAANDAIAHVRNRVLLLQFMVQLHGLVMQTNAKETETSDSVMQLVMEKLKENAALPYERKWLREWTSYHENHAARLFQKRFGLSPHAFFIERKMHLAKQWLSTTDMPVSEIAERLHVGTIHYFSRLFKTQTGQTPTAYRQLRHMI
ncbi:hypothetical protein DQG23_28145 [Paenibacillus contaminans]|uniref:HTH araC/xylS-type domain-containing protein n=1 Tax=Paenibacillus contaminans TaxID=450362 RepID=A0A329MA46_9BACL|nr:hypothetical protein DQG23_28145 [Paenibacillus contaminans]